MGWFPSGSGYTKVGVQNTPSHGPCFWIKITICFFFKYIFEVNRSVGGELVVLHKDVRMFSCELGKFWCTCWSRCGSLNTKHSTSIHQGPNLFWHVKEVLENGFGP